MVLVPSTMRRALRIGETVHGEVAVATQPDAVVVPVEALVPEGDGFKVFVVDAEGIAHGKSADLVELDDALNELATFDERQSKIVEMRFFGGLSLEETAEALKISARTVQREWSLAQAWLYRELSKGVCQGE